MSLTLNQKTVGIFPASGGLGGSTYNHLLKKVPHTTLTLISRYPEKTPSIHQQQGVTLRRASYESTPAELEDAFAGIEVLFLISYPSHVRDYRVQVQLPAIDAAYKAGVKHIFYSSLAFALPDKTESKAEVMKAHLETEKYLKHLAATDAGFTWTSIREGLYSESFPIYTSFWTLENPRPEILIPHDGSAPGISWAKRDELGEATAALIARCATPADRPSSDLRNKAVVLTGPRAWSLFESIQVLGKAVGKDIRIRKVGVDEWAKQQQIVDYFKNETEARTWATAWEAIEAGETSFASTELEAILGREPEPFDETIRKMVEEITK
ncbi:hypothetical protein FZEAL_254 [Fusarium zealandicum]|uniref:NmrA-like domain-containing protein n=1 Tax=Fusarium zealandicum TaxID=1053134 RepID=A0A8H4UVT0_9HYPO|nr:hypothetical protein FZEAL_254 [Fusarium zealandicum]